MNESEALTRGRELAAAILQQWDRFCLAPGNKEEGKRLDLLQGEFVEWERRTQMHFPDIHMPQELQDARLRPAPKKIGRGAEAEYLRLRRQWTMDDELRAYPVRLEQVKEAGSDDGGMWSGTLGI